MAQAEVKEKQSLGKSNQNYKDVYTAQLEAAQARAELAQLELDRLTLRAPFAGKIIALPVSSGQYVLKGTVIAELADITSLKSLVPVDRRSVSERADLKVFVEEQEQDREGSVDLAVAGELCVAAGARRAVRLGLGRGGQRQGGAVARTAGPQREPADHAHCHGTQGCPQDDRRAGGFGGLDGPGLAQRVRDQCAGGRAGQDRA